MDNKELYEYTSDKEGFISVTAFGLRSIYFPLCATDAMGIKSSITPRLSGDIKIDKERFLTKPASVEDLRQDLRNFFCHIKGEGVVSLTSGDLGAASAGGATDDTCKGAGIIEAGMLWHKLTRTHARAGLTLEGLNFVPADVDGIGENVELMRVTVRNIGKEPRSFTPTFALPLFARALANKHDHEHVTSLLHRIEQVDAGDGGCGGVCVAPKMLFDERGHRTIDTVYFVLGVDDGGAGPVGTFPTFEGFYGEAGDISAPEAVVRNLLPSRLSQEELNGKEAVGALRFADVTLQAGEEKAYYFTCGIGAGRGALVAAQKRYVTPAAFNAALDANKAYWKDKTGAITFATGDARFDAWMRWVCLQPVLRRIYGCSFLPDHDYGKGGKGWRDIWQDLLSLILLEPDRVRQALIDNFAGVRIDGSNATIIGEAPGTFIGDRNAITRVWMDHGVWPLMTLMLYIDQTGDYDILLEENTYFRDTQLARTREKDYFWTPDDGHQLVDKNGRVVRGTLIEHVLVEHLTQFFNVGEHNLIRLEDADWNDGLDMARDRGESVAFTAAYAGNLMALADLLERFVAATQQTSLRLAVEVAALVDSLAVPVVDLLGAAEKGGRMRRAGVAQALSSTPLDYADAGAKRRYLHEGYFPSVQPAPSGEQAEVSIAAVADDLRRKGQWIFDHVRVNEMVTAGEEDETRRWFNGYYDNAGRQVEGSKDGHVRMTLAGQVFPVMSGLASDEEVRGVVEAVDTYLCDVNSGGVRLNTDFGVDTYLDLGRAFGFAYGTKENGAVFSHMAVMYAAALYRRGFAREGYRVLNALYAMAADSAKSKIYPGLPEYFDGAGRGRYHYLTGSASWFVLVELTEAFGVRGNGGDLVVAPKLVSEQFDPAGAASVTSCFAGRTVTVTYQNPMRLDHGVYKVTAASLNGMPVDVGEDGNVRIPRAAITDAKGECTVVVRLDSGRV